MATDIGSMVGGGTNYEMQEFLASGTFTPPMTGTYLVTLVGGGGSGCAARGNSAYLSQGGWSGEQIVSRPVQLTINVGVTVTIGAGGVVRSLTAGSAASSAGLAGGNTSFGSLVAAGGQGGGTNCYGVVAPGCIPGGSSNPVSGGQGTFALANSQLAEITDYRRGGAGLFGPGGQGDGTSLTAIASAAGANSGAGGGGSITSSTNYASTSGAGGSGRVIVEWWG